MDNCSFMVSFILGGNLDAGKKLGGGAIPHSCNFSVLRLPIGDVTRKVQ